AFWCVQAWVGVRAPGRALFSYDSAQYALAGRELAEHGALATPYAYVGTLREGSPPPYPLLAGHPLVPLLLAPLFRLFGAHAWVSLLPVALAYLVTVLCAAELVLRSGGSPVLAGAVGAALAGTPLALANATDGLSEMPAAAAWTGAMLILARMRREPRPGWLG